MPWDPEEHRKKVQLRAQIDKRRLTSYWPFFWECSTCDAPEGKPCWNLHDRLSKIRPNPKDWKTNYNAHPKRIKMTKEEYRERQRELEKKRIEEHKAYMASTKRYVAERFGLYID